ncbi:hypothetical protein BJ944DRAFT_250764 [Cunninghamella echinulata]|nr:hypothetical protein BJ944DRAFT_250764 [Cunninghamella echinulata]
MSKRFQNLNKYRNSVGSASKKELWYSDIPISTSSSDCSTLIQVNRTWIATKWSGPGSIGLLALDNPGKTCGKQARVVHAHGCSISDWHLSPFDDHLLATGAEDSMVKLWKIPGKEDPDDIEATCLSTLTISSRRVDMVRFHPSTDQIVTTLGNDGKKVCIWDIEKSTSVYDLLSTKSPFQHFSWKSDGSLLATCGKGVLQIWDPRADQDKVLQTGNGHYGIKGSRIVWLGDSNHIFTVGTDMMRSRQYGVWDSRNLSKPILLNSLDSSTGTLLPLYDEDTETMYLVSKGDSTIRSLQFSNTFTSPTVSENLAFGTNVSLQGAALLPKSSLNVMHAEIARLMTVTENAVIPVSFEVPRKQYIDFHADLFPDTKGHESALSSTDWFSGKTNQVKLISLDPAKKKVSSPASTTKSNNLIKQTNNNNTVSHEQKTTNTTIENSTSITTNNSNQTNKDDIKKSDNITISGNNNSDLTQVSNENNNKSPVTEPKSHDNNNAVMNTNNDAKEIANSSTNKNTTAASDSSSQIPKEEIKTLSPSSTTATITTVSKPIIAKKPKYGSTHLSPYKYIDNKVYHPNTHYDSLEGLNINKSGTTELLQANHQFIAVALSGSGGRLGIILTSKPGRLPTRLPSLITGSDITYYQFDPFDPYTIAVASDDNKIKLFNIPENGLEEDLLETNLTLHDPHMDKVNILSYHPTTKNILATASYDIGKPAIRIWNVKEQRVVFTFKIDSEKRDGTILAMVWRPDGKAIATFSKDKMLRVIHARTGEVLYKVKSHDGIRPSRLVWADDNILISVGFGLGSMREVLVFNTSDPSIQQSLAKKSIDISPSIMNIYFDRDCQVLFVAGKGDRTIHTFELETNEKTVNLTPLVKLEFGSLQQGISFLPKRYCDVMALEIDKFYRLSSTSIEPVGIRIPRARPEYFQDDIFVPTLDIEHEAQDESSWLNGNDKNLEYISLQPDGVKPLSQAPPPPQGAASKAKFESGKRQVSEDQQRQETMNRMFANAKDVDKEEEDRKKREEVKNEDHDVDEDEWDD